MGFMATIKAQQAMRAHGKGDLDTAKKLYEEAIDKGLMSARPMLGYAILLIREGSYDKATKTIEVMTKVLRTFERPAYTAAPTSRRPSVTAIRGLCPRCRTYCYGDCMA